VRVQVQAQVLVVLVQLEGVLHLCLVSWMGLLEVADLVSLIRLLWLIDLV
jgi:hypothetical protein